MNWLDRAIAVFAPVAAEKRVASRARIHRMLETRNLFEAASAGRRTAGWRSVGTDSNTEIRTAAGRLRDVASDMVRNHPYAASGQRVIRTNVVGTGIIPNISGTTADRTSQLQDLFAQHFDRANIDADGRHTLYGLQALVMNSVVERGAALIRRRPRQTKDKLPLPFQIQVLEPDFLDTSRQGPQANGNYCVDGIEFDFIGKRVAYYLWDEHPGARLGAKIGQESRRISADFVAHVYRVDRPGQVNGVTWFHPVIMRIRDWADYTDAQLLRQKIAACFAAFISTEQSFDWSGTIDSTSATGIPVETLEPGQIERLRAGEKIEFATPPSTADYGPYAKVTLHEIAAGLGVPYEELTKDLSEVSYISGRLGRGSFRTSVEEWRWNMLIPQMLHPLEAWTREAVALQTGSTEPFVIGWTPPGWEMVDPKAEVPAQRDEIRSGLTSRSAIIRRRGEDPEQVNEEILRDRAWAIKNDVVLDSDPSKVSGRGVAQKADAAAAAAGGGATDNAAAADAAAADAADEAAAALAA